MGNQSPDMKVIWQTRLIESSSEGAHNSQFHPTGSEASPAAWRVSPGLPSQSPLEAPQLPARAPLTLCCSLAWDQAQASPKPRGADCVRPRGKKGISAPVPHTHRDIPGSPFPQPHEATAAFRLLPRWDGIWEGGKELAWAGGRTDLSLVYSEISVCIHMSGEGEDSRANVFQSHTHRHGFACMQISNPELISPKSVPGTNGSDLFVAMHGILNVDSFGSAVMPKGLLNFSKNCSSLEPKRGGKENEAFFCSTRTFLPRGHF